MFTGIVEEIGFIKSIKKSGHSIKLSITCETVLESTKIGDSISTDGVCLTVTALGSNYFEADLMPETVHMSGFSKKKVGDPVNLERAMRLGDRFGGHMVSGHIDGTGYIKRVIRDEIAYRISISCSSALLRYMIQKGSIAIDGISLTIVSVGSSEFEVSIIPQTQDDTTLLKKKVGDIVNLENDMVSKYIERLTQKTGIDKDFLAEHGFM
ncbi:riboflavin synthase [Acidaminobacter sp. JC074]|uniref:riboflavin synthase n=1 Tax=Acidaminobacter sp. JC074 TaxID=2530199 RepID=UPI001F0D3FBF|nr:riboflavin synthase [Acidaminobacter sp. JC074]